MYYTIDRFEGEYAVCECENGSFTSIQKNKIPPSAKEGDILLEEEAGFTIDCEKTAERKAEMQRLLDKLWE